MKYNRLILFLSLQLLFLFCAMAQETGGAVCISEDGSEPDPSAILDIKSNKKGVLLPRMSLEVTAKIENKYDGLTVFITDSTKQGYWYWNEFESKWKQLRNDDTDEQDIEAPCGGIIMYSGKVDASLFDTDGAGLDGTKMQGWAICNGLNDTPNLSGKFIMGTSIGSEIGQEGGSDTLRLKPENMPVHRHETNTVPGTISKHTHTISDVKHLHSVDGTWSRIQGFNRSTHIEVRSGGSEQVSYLPQTEFDAGPEGKLKLLEYSDVINFNSEIDKIVVKDAGTNDGIENRPSFYVLLYLMRMYTSDCQ